MRCTAFLAIGLVLLACGNTMASTYNSPGPYATRSICQPVTISLEGSTGSARRPSGSSPKQVTVDTTVTYPTSGQQPFPVVVLFNGFQAKADWYSDLVKQVASWGYTVLQYTLRGVTIVKDTEELRYLTPLLSWLAAQGAQATGDLSGVPDLSQLATAGHSRGGKLAALHYAGRSDVATAVLLDPVDNSSWAPAGPDFPSAAKALAAVNKTAGVVGAGISGPCNPVKANYKVFFSPLAPGSWQLVISQAGHMQFVRTGNPFVDWSAKLLCKAGKISNQEVIKHAGAFTVAWLESSFRAGLPETSARQQEYRDWVADQETKKVVTFSVKTAAA